MTKVTLTTEGKLLNVRVLDGDLSLINSLRRIVLAEIPYVALLHEPYASDGSQFVFRKNTSVLHNHMLAHRLMMAPIHLSRMESQAYIPNSLRVKLVAENRGTAPLDVTTKDVQLLLHDQPHPDRDRLYPPDPDTGDWILLNVLKPGEQLDIEATVVSGVAYRHAAFAVASLCTFAPTLDEALVAEGREKAGETARELNRFEFTERKRCWAPGPDGRPTAFDVTIESECGLTAAEIWELALEVLENKLRTCKCAAKQVEGYGDGDAYELKVRNEDHTLGNLLQSTTVDAFGEDCPILFVGYHCPHPLDKCVVFKVVIKKDTIAPDAAFELMKQHALKKVLSMKS